jgi:membrane-associated phospholipid phosphatase
LRSFIVGGPAVLVLQRVLGATRPEVHTHGSRWVPFYAANSVSGHAFVGGISFINAAMITDNVPLKSALYAASVLPAWSRVIQDKHYLSQAILGWWMAYLSASAVDWTENSKSDWLVTPVMSDEGISVCWTRTW